MLNYNTLIIKEQITMSIRKRKSKKSKKKFTYQVYFPYVDENGVSDIYRKGGFTDIKDAEAHEIIKKNEYLTTGTIVKDADKKFKQKLELYFNNSTMTKSTLVVLSEMITILTDNKAITTTTKKTLNHLIELKSQQSTHALESVYNDYITASISNKSLSPNSVYLYNATFKKHVPKEIKNSDIRDINYKRLEELFSSIQSDSVLKTLRNVIANTFNYAMKCEYVINNPCLLIELPETESSKEKNKIISEDVFIMLIKSASYTDNKVDIFVYQAIVIALYTAKYTALRVAELLALKKEDIDFQNKTISVNEELVYVGLKKSEVYTKTSLKNKASKSAIPLAKSLETLLLEWFIITPYDYLFTDQYGDFILPSRIREFLNRFKNKNNIENLHMHMFRHTLATKLEQENVSLAIRKKMLRHTIQDVTLGTYTHITTDDVKEQLDKVFQ